MASILVSGAAEHVSNVADALRQRGASVTEVTDIKQVPAVCADAGAKVFDAYVQLPARFTVQGSTAIDRVHHFFGAGVLARFVALDGALPSLVPGARVIFVMGQLPPDADTPDDKDARRALVRVLAHAARADAAGGRLLTRVLDTGSSSPEDIGLVALGRGRSREDIVAELDDKSYADWRVEMMGLISINI